MKIKKTVVGLFLAFASAGTFAEGAQFKFYRFTVDAPRNGSSSMQLSDVELYDESGTKIPRLDFTFRYDSHGYGIGRPWPDGEGPENAVDGNLETKWLDWRAGFNADKKQREAVYLEFNFKNPRKVSGYAWYTANDFPERNPASWRFLGSNDGENWIELDKVTRFYSCGFKTLGCKRLFGEIEKAKAPKIVSSADAEDILDFVDPFIGTAGVGHTTPAAAYPFGMVQPGPDTGLEGWERTSSYQHGDESIKRFSQTHLSGTGCSDFSDVAFMPFIGDIDEAVRREFKDGIVKAREKASPGYYAVELKSGIKVEVTCSEHVAVYRIKFAKGPARLLYDPTWGHGRVAAADIRPMKNRRVSGHVGDRRGWPDRDYYFAWEVSAEPTDARVIARIGNDRIPLTVYSFDNLKEGDELYLKVSLSRSSEKGARGNIDAEVPGWDFDGTLEAVRAKWRSLLSRVGAKGEPDDLKVLYTAIYHLCFQPNRLSDAGEEPLYSTFSCWDIYRAAGPLYTILTPEYVPYFVNSMLWHFDRNGFLPVWTLWGRDNQCMIGAHSVPMIVDAYLKGFEGVDWETAFDCVKTTLTKNRKRHKARYDLIEKYGYYPCDIIKDESVSRLLEDCYDQSCAARFAKALGKAEDAAFFHNRSRNWTNVFDSATLFMRGKDSRGNWGKNFDPYRVSHIANCEYTEGNAFHWNWHVMQEPELLVKLLGGKAKAVERLVNLFNEDSSKSAGKLADVTGLIGQYCHGNEPSHHNIYFFSLLGRRDLTAKYVREVCETQYYVTPDGICGNEDCGQMSAWYVFSSLGFYPFDPCGGEYVLGESQFDEISIKTPNGKTFRITSDCAGKSDKKVMLNGKTIDRATINHKDVISGGTLRFVK